MSVMIKYNESFYDVLFAYFTKLTETIPNGFTLVFTGFIIAVFYICYRVHERCFKVVTHETKCNSLEVEQLRNYNRLLVRHQSIICHKYMLKTLEYVADKCSDKVCALKCIDIVVYCPHLLNIKNSVNGVTPFHRICYRGHTCLITFMLAKGADPFITTIAGENALCMAVHHFLHNPTKDDFSCLEILYKTGCKFGFKNEWYNAFLKMAFTNNHIRLGQWLILHCEGQSHNALRCTSIPPMLNNKEFN